MLVHHPKRLYLFAKETILNHQAYFPLGDSVRATRSENKNRHRDWLKLAGEKIRREQVGTVPTFLSVSANKFAKWKIGLRL